MSDVILGIWKRYTKLSIQLARLTPVVAAVEVEEGKRSDRRDEK